VSTTIDPATNIITSTITTTITQNPQQTVDAVIGIASTAVASIVEEIYKRKHPFNLKMSHNFNIPEGKLLKLKFCKTGADAGTQKELPAVVDLRNKFHSPYDQGALGSCTANALCSIVGYLDPKMDGSRLFLYYNEREMEGNVADDSGAYLSDGIQSLEKNGVCNESLWKYDIAKFATKPDAQCYADAMDHQVLQSRQLYNDIYIMKSALAEGYPFVVGITIYESFENEHVARTGIVPMPNVAREQMLGGHAVCCVGYDDNKKMWIMRNSWGGGWGDGGYFYLPYNYLLDSSMATDLWTIINMEVPVPGNNSEKH
jgi:C1A family cysteine protease